MNEPFHIWMSYVACVCMEVCVCVSVCVCKCTVRVSALEPQE